MSIKDKISEVEEEIEKLSKKSNEYELAMNELEEQGRLGNFYQELGSKNEKANNKIKINKVKLQTWKEAQEILDEREKEIFELAELWQMFGYISVLQGHPILKKLAKITEDKIIELQYLKGDKNAK